MKTKTVNCFECQHFGSETTFKGDYLSQPECRDWCELDDRVVPSDDLPISECAQYEPMVNKRGERTGVCPECFFHGQRITTLLVDFEDGWVVCPHADCGLESGYYKSGDIGQLWSEEAIDAVGSHEKEAA